MSYYKLGEAIFRENLNAKGLEVTQKEDLYEKYWSIVAPFSQTSILITGKIEVDTHENGNSFTVLLPFKLPSKKKVEAKEENSFNQLGGKRIL